MEKSWGPEGKTINVPEDTELVTSRAGPRALGAFWSALFLCHSMLLPTEHSAVSPQQLCFTWLVMLLFYMYSSKQIISWYLQYLIRLSWNNTFLSKAGIARTFLKFQATDYMKKVAFSHRSSVILQKRVGKWETNPFVLIILQIACSFLKWYSEKVCVGYRHFELTWCGLQLDGLPGGLSDGEKM